jgi:ParB family chromosome partitioning protein
MSKSSFPHPRQAELPATTAAEDAALLDDIRRNGMLEPIEILPDGTIISGHRRWAAAQQLDRPSVRVIVRNDLAAQGQVAVERRYLEANLNRRQLSKHDAIVLYVRLRQLSPRGRERRGLGSLRNEVAERYQMSGRNLDRWASVFEGPQGNPAGCYE